MYSCTVGVDATVEGEVEIYESFDGTRPTVMVR